MRIHKNAGMASLRSEKSIFVIVAVIDNPTKMSMAPVAGEGIDRKNGENNKASAKQAAVVRDVSPERPPVDGHSRFVEDADNRTYGIEHVYKQKREDHDYHLYREYFGKIELKENRLYRRGQVHEPRVMSDTHRNTDECSEQNTDK